MASLDWCILEQREKREGKDVRDRVSICRSVANSVYVTVAVEKKKREKWCTLKIIYQKFPKFKKSNSPRDPRGSVKTGQNK